MLISNHTFSNLVLRPNGVNPNTIGHDGKPVGDAPDEAALKRSARGWRRRTATPTSTAGSSTTPPGTTEDWSYNATGGFGYTFEIGANEFHPPYPEVVDEYLGAGKYRGKGNREAYLIALEHAVDKRYSGVLKGKAPKGAVHPAARSVRDADLGGLVPGRRQHRDHGRPASGDFSWIVNPSTRPVVRPRPYQKLADHAVPRAGRSRAPTPARTPAPTTSSCSPSDADLWRTTLDWPTPDDLDLEVYRKGADGTADRGRLLRATCPARRRSVEVPGAAGRAPTCCGSINYASATPSYTLTAALFDDPDPPHRRQARGLHPHLREARQGPPDRPRLHRPR